MRLLLVIYVYNVMINKRCQYLYNIAINKNLHNDDILYITSMNKYINSYENFKESKSKQYIQDLNE
jgi:hypothetical protein